MKLFNLKEYLENPTKEIITKKGRKVRILCTDRKDSYFPIVALVEWEDKKETIEETMHYTKDGKWIIGCDSGNDLCFAPEKHEGWINVYVYVNDDQSYTAGHVFASKEEAEVAGDSCNTYITTLKIEWEE